VAKVNSSSSTPAISSNVAELKDIVRALLLDKKNQSLAPAPSPTSASVKAVESNCVTCGGTHSYQNCPATSGNVYQDNIQETRVAGLCWGMMVEVMGSSGSGGKEAGNVGEGSCRDGGKV
nr:reverse transcriptase domain-containing protein [Tanacetum cinerariifolium]